RLAQGAPPPGKGRRIENVETELLPRTGTDLGAGTIALGEAHCRPRTQRPAPLYTDSLEEGARYFGDRFARGIHEERGRPREISLSGEVVISVPEDAEQLRVFGRSPPRGRSDRNERARSLSIDARILAEPIFLFTRGARRSESSSARLLRLSVIDEPMGALGRVCLSRGVPDPGAPPAASDGERQEGDRS